MHALISTEALAQRLAQPDAVDRLRMFDATVHLRPAQPGPYVIESGRADYEAAHIPSAAFIDLGHELSDTRSKLRFTMPPAAQLQAALSAAGLSNGNDCVIYSSSTPMWATRLWWMLRSLGFDAAVLDGGLAKWRAEGRALASGTERYPAGQFRAMQRFGLWADQAEVLRAVGDAAVCTINALSAPSHAGNAAAHYGRPGHIAGSVNVPYATLLNGDGTFKSAAELRPAFDGVGALGMPRAICYCGGGISATMDALALTLLGHANVAVYDGSLSEWARDPTLPMATATRGFLPGLDSRVDRDADRV
jgi:thiosulfate/3-mercaptopyruvate sulfurtransferase